MIFQSSDARTSAAARISRLKCIIVMCSYIVQWNPRIRGWLPQRPIEKSATMWNLLIPRQRRRVPRVALIHAKSFLNASTLMGCTLVTCNHGANQRPHGNEGGAHVLIRCVGHLCFYQVSRYGPNNTVMSFSSNRYVARTLLVQVIIRKGYRWHRCLVNQRWCERQTE